MCVREILWRKSLYFIIFSDLVLAYINLNFAHDTLPHNSDICDKLYRNSFMQLDKFFQWSRIFYLDLWPRGLVLAQDTASQSGEHSYEISLEYLHACSSYPLDKIWTPPANRPPSRLPTWGEMYNASRFSKGHIKRE
jgi:hypothetical protein